MNRIANTLLFLAAAASALAAQTPSSAPSLADNPAAQVRQAKSWEYGPFVNFGNGFGNRDNYRFFWAGVQAGKQLTPVLHAGMLSGQFEYGANIQPLWQAYTPAPHTESSTCVVNNVSQPCTLQVGGGTFYGVSIMPVIFRWNFLTRSRRIQPWFQAAGGLIYTTHKFPPSYLTTQNVDSQTVAIDGGTCVWNFTPQGGGGIHYFLRPGRSIDLGINAVHVSSASLGDRNPGVNASIQVQVGYTFWK